MKAPLTEFIGTFFLVLTIGLCVVAGSPYAPIAIGCALMVMVYMGGHVSGAHYNPAVTLALTAAGKSPVKNLVPYMLAQVAGAAVAALAVRAMLGKTFAPAPGANVGVVPALLAEVLFTFALALVVLNVACSEKTKGNSYYGLAIGFTVLAAAFAAGGVSGGAFNPAVGIGPTVIHATMGPPPAGAAPGPWAHLWLYLVGPFAGGLLASVVFKAQEG